MTRGNQREKAREKNMKAAAGQKNKSALSNSERLQQADKLAQTMKDKLNLTPEQKAEKDAKLAAKEKKAAEAKAYLSRNDSKKPIKK